METSGAASTTDCRAVPCVYVHCSKHTRRRAVHLLTCCSDMEQVQNFADPGSLAGLSVATVLLSLAGNGLMVPRALLTRDAVWLAGSGWATLMGWAQLLSMFAGRSAAG